MRAENAGEWYHGSPVRLTYLRVGSTITQDRGLARVFSHKPSLVVQEVNDRGESAIKHDGKETGFLYRVAEPVMEGDVRPHPETTMMPGQEWLVNRELRVELIGPTEPLPEEALSEDEIASLRRKLADRRADGGLSQGKP